jgi:hypothetical protein
VERIHLWQQSIAACTTLFASLHCVSWLCSVYHSNVLVNTTVRANVCCLITIFCNARKLQNRIVTKMHEILRPFVLRRLKREVLGDKLPPKVHYNLWVLCA